MLKLLLTFGCIFYLFLPTVTGLIGGQLASRHEFPGAALIKTSNTAGTPLCGGLIMSQANYILTSSTCTAQNGTSWAFAGLHDSNFEEITMQQSAILRKVLVDPLEGPGLLLFRLETGFETNDFVDSWEINKTRKSEWKQGDVGIIPGWGSRNIQNPDSQDRKLRKASVPTISSAEPECSNQTSSISPESYFCGGSFAGGIGGCGADTGGPLFCEGIPCGILIHGSCGHPRKLDIYANILYYIEAIQDAIEADAP